MQVMRKPMRKWKRIGFTKRMGIRALADSGLSEGKVASIVGVAPSTVHAIKMDPDLSPEIITNLKDSIAGRFYKKAHLALNEISPEKLARVDPYRLMLISKIGVDAARLAEGLPTQIVQTKSLAVKLRGEITDLYKRKQEVLKSLGGTSRDLPSSNVKRVRESDTILDGEVKDK